MKKTAVKILTVLLCVLLCVSMCSCQWVEEALSSLDDTQGMAEDTSLSYTKINEVSFEYSPHYKPVENRNSYNLLESDDMRVLYDKLYEYIHYVYPKANEAGEYKTKQVILQDVLLSESDIRLTIKALTDDNPHVFWLSDTFGFLKNTDENYTAVQLFSRLSSTELTQCVKKLQSSANSFYSTLRDGLSQYELELLIHDYLLAICEYDKSVEVDDSGFPQTNTNAFDVYGALVDKKAVCEGYARAFGMLCNSVGIECINVIGNSQGELHMWNAVKIDGDYYFVDTTWNDSADDANKYDYFNINETQLKHDHEFSKLASEMTVEEICGNGKLNALTSNFEIPKCTEDEYNYYIQTAPAFVSYSGEEVIQGLYEAAKNKEEYFHIYIDENAFDYNYAVNQLFFSQPQYFFNYTSVVNSRLSDYSIDVNNMSIFQKEHLSVVTVVLKYI